MSLFRQEVLDAKQRPALGEILLARPISLAFFVGLALIVFFTLVAFLVWGEYTRKERLRGRIVLTQGLSKVYSPLVGTVVSKTVQEGQKVVKGQPLYVVSIERMTSKGGTQEAIGGQIIRQRDSLKAQLVLQHRVFKEEEDALNKRLVELEKQRSQLHREIDTQTKRVALTDASFARFRELSNASFISPIQLSEREQQKLEQEARLQQLQRTETGLQTEIGTVMSALRNAPLNARNQLAGIERSISTSEQEDLANEARREVTIFATQDGTATAVLSEIGQTVTPQTLMLSLLPVNARFDAHLYAPSRAIGFLTGTETVQLRYDAFPYQKFGQYGGKIRSISRAALSSAELQLENAAPETLYRITVTLDQQSVVAYGKQTQLQDGMALEADVLLDTRKLYEWVLLPLYSMTGKL